MASPEDPSLVGCATSSLPLHRGSSPPAASQGGRERQDPGPTVASRSPGSPATATRARVLGSFVDGRARCTSTAVGCGRAAVFAIERCRLASGAVIRPRRIGGCVSVRLRARFANATRGLKACGQAATLAPIAVATLEGRRVTGCAPSGRRSGSAGTAARDSAPYARRTRGPGATAGDLLGRRAGGTGSTAIVWGSRSARSAPGTATATAGATRKSAVDAEWSS